MYKKRLVVISDLHCGHKVGLTPPKYQSAIFGDAYLEAEREMYGAYKQIINNLKPIDILGVNGDCVDGKGRRSGGTELLTADMDIQAKMAEDAIKEAEAKSIIMTHGTPYHVEDDTETRIAKHLGAEIKSHAFFEINGVMFSMKHKPSGSSQIPYSKGTPIAKDWMYNLLWAEHEEEPKCDVFIRSHVHNFFHAGSVGWLGLTTPALQGKGSKFGSRQCSQVVHFGVVHFDIYENGEYSWKPHTFVVESQKIRPLKF